MRLSASDFQVREACRNLDEDFAKLAKAHELADGTTCNILFFFTDASDVNLDGTIATKRKVRHGGK